MQPFFHLWLSPCSTDSYEFEFIPDNNCANILSLDIETKSMQEMKQAFDAQLENIMCPKNIANIQQKITLDKKFKSKQPWKVYVACGSKGGRMDVPCDSFTFFDNEDGPRTLHGPLTLGGEMGMK